MRKTGYTTRLVDKGIQSLFTYGWVKFITSNRYEYERKGISEEECAHCLLTEKITEHQFSESVQSKMNEFTFEIMRRRLMMEHSHLEKDFEFNSDFSIRIKNFHKK